MDENFEKLRIMIIGDSKTIRRTAEARLKKVGCKVVTGFDAQTWIVETRPHVIVLTSKDGLFDKPKGRIAGSDKYLTKPFGKEELLDAIREYRSAA